MAPIFLPLILLASRSSISSNPRNTNSLQEITKTLSVCQSPGCKADGAEATLKKLTALAPSNVNVRPGSCASLCGQGPVIMESKEDSSGRSSRPIVHTRVRDAALTNFLLSQYSETDDDAMWTRRTKSRDTLSYDLLKGYDTVQKAEDAFNVAKDYVKAAQLFDEGLELALQLALRENELSSPRLEWLIVAHRDYAKVLVELFYEDNNRRKKGKNNDKRRKRSKDNELLKCAMSVAETSVTLSCGKSALSYEILAEVCCARDDVVAEREALRKVFKLEPENSTSLSFEVANRRRELGFRLAKLDRYLQSYI